MASFSVLRRFSIFKICHSPASEVKQSLIRVQYRFYASARNNATQYIWEQTKRLKEENARLAGENQRLQTHLMHREQLSLDMRNTLHWVIKTGNLRRSIDFYRCVFQMSVQRHEDFESGCDAECNGAFDRPWSKTMIGYGDERKRFALELTYNYGIKGYARGNDLKYIGLRVTPKALDVAKEMGYAVTLIDTSATAETAEYEIVGPDEVNHRCVVCADADMDPAADELFTSIALNCNDINETYAYWVGLLGMNCMQLGDDYMRVQYGDGVPLEFYQLPKGQRVDHAKAEGRIAFTTAIENGVNVLYEYYQYMEEQDSDVDGGNKYMVHTPPVVLETAGKADCHVMVLQDVNQHQICFAQKDGFFDLCSSGKNLTDIDWSERKENGADLDKGQFIN